MQLTLKVILNSRPNEVEFYSTILHSTHDILARDVDNDNTQMEVDKEDLRGRRCSGLWKEDWGL